MSGPIDVFIAAGQSNAAGKGTAASSPATTPDMAYKFTSGGVLQQMTDPVGTANTGSAWPSFANALTATTNTPMCIVATALSGTALIQESDTGEGNWSPTGGLFSASETRTLAALHHLIGAGWEPILQGVLWHQGEWDAEWYPSQSTLGADYRTAFEALNDRYKTALGNAIRLYTFRVGTRVADPVKPGYAVVRSAQDAACAAVAGMEMVYTDCVNFPALGYMKGDGLNYNQAVLNAMGAERAPLVAANIIAHPTPEPATGRNGILARRLLAFYAVTDAQRCKAHSGEQVLKSHGAPEAERMAEQLSH